MQHGTFPPTASDRIDACGRRAEANARGQYFVNDWEPSDGARVHGSVSYTTQRHADAGTFWGKYPPCRISGSWVWRSWQSACLRCKEEFQPQPSARSAISHAWLSTS